MLIGNSSNKPRLETVRHLKRALREALELSEDATVTVTQLTCLEQGCAPVETVFGLLRPGAAQRQSKVHKPADAIDAEDLQHVCAAWGFDIEVPAFKPLDDDKG